MNFASKEQRPSQAKPQRPREAEGETVQGMMQQNPDAAVQRMQEQADQVNASQIQRKTFNGKAADETNYTNPDPNVQRMIEQANDLQKPETNGVLGKASNKAAGEDGTITKTETEELLVKVESSE